MKEESISAGVRRITALTGKGLTNYLLERSQVVDELCVSLKVPLDQLPARVNKLLEDNKKLAKQLKAASKQGGTDAMGQARKLLDEADKIGDAHVIAGPLEGVPLQQAREAMDMLKKKAPSAAIVLGLTEADKVTLLVGVTDDLIQRGVKAGDIVKTIAPIVGGGGGGRPQMAQAGGKDPAKLGDALTRAKEMIRGALGG